MYNIIRSVDYDPISLKTRPYFCLNFEIIIVYDNNLEQFLMSNDCQNEWGCALAVCYTNKRKSTSGTSGDSRNLRDKIASTFSNKWVLAKVMSCGTDANMFAVMSATNGDTNTILVAAGSYVAGDNGPMQIWSTSTISLQHGIPGMAPPSDVKHPFTRKHIVALPYCIAGVLSEQSQKTYENECIEKLHLRCLVAKVRDRPYKCIMLELMLASNGASLSDRCLIMLANLADSFGIFFLLDEIMTAGRTGTMLMLQSKPTSFIKRVSHVTLGKWTQKGIVLVSPQFHEESKNSSDHTERRMNSVSVDCSDVLLHWDAVKQNLQNCQLRREIVVGKIQIEERETWGEGTLIFVPKERVGLIFGLRNRLLPLLDIDTPVDSIPFKSTKWNKTAVNAQLVDCVLSWKNITVYEDEVDEYIFKLVKYLVENTDLEHDLKTIHANVFPLTTSRTAAGILRRVEMAGLLKYKMVGLKRLRCWIVSGLCIRGSFTM